MKYKHLLFDADNTLLDFSKGEIDTFEELGRIYNFEVNKKIMDEYHIINKKCWKDYEEGRLSQDVLRVLRFENFIKHFNLDIDSKEMEKDFTRILSTQTHVIKDTHLILDTLSKKGYQIQMITNGLAEAQYGRLKATDTEKYFLNVYVSGEMGCQKPDIEYFDKVLEDIKADNKSCLVIGDRLESDIKGAMNSNIDSVWLNLHKADLPQEYKPTYVINELKDLLDLL